MVRGLAAGLLELAVWVTHLPAADVSAWLLIGAIVVAAVWPRLRATIGAERGRFWGLTLAYIGMLNGGEPLSSALNYGFVGAGALLFVISLAMIFKYGGNRYDVYF